MNEGVDRTEQVRSTRVSFPALRHPGFRVYFFASALAMMADSIEHVISYWIMFQKFHSPALAGFAIISHWLPFLLFSIYAGALADRFDPRRIIQIGMLLFMAASIGWGYFFVTDTLQMWHAVVLLVLHGFAGRALGPGGQLLIHDIVGERRSAERGAAQRHGALARPPARPGGRQRDHCSWRRPDLRHFRQCAVLPAAAASGCGRRRMARASASRRPPAAAVARLRRRRSRRARRSPATAPSSR